MTRHGRRPATRWSVQVGPLDPQRDRRAFSVLANRGLLARATLVQREGDNDWLRADDVPELAQLLGHEPFSLRRCLEKLEGLLADWLAHPKVPMPPEVEQTLAEYKREGTGIVVVAQGRVHGRPALIVLRGDTEAELAIVQEVELDTSGWSRDRVESWPDSDSSSAQRYVWRADRDSGEE